MLWGCMTWEGVGFTTKIDGRMDGDLYLQILKEAIPSTDNIQIPYSIQN